RFDELVVGISGTSLYNIGVILYGTKRRTINGESSLCNACKEFPASGRSEEDSRRLLVAWSTQTIRSMRLGSSTRCEPNEGSQMGCKFVGCKLEGNRLV